MNERKAWGLAACIVSAVCYTAAIMLATASSAYPEKTHAHQAMIISCVVALVAGVVTMLAFAVLYLSPK